jgi:hypothetical protein
MMNRDKERELADQLKPVIADRWQDAYQRPIAPEEVEALRIKYWQWAPDPERHDKTFAAAWVAQAAIDHDRLVDELLDRTALAEARAMLYGEDDPPEDEDDEDDD